MRLELDSYVIESDENNFTLKEVKIKTSGKKIGEEYLDVVGYYGNVDRALIKYVNLSVKKCDTAEEILKEINRLYELIKEKA